MSTKPAVLILCTGNSCRSHMAEGILRAASKGTFEVASAGSRPAGYVHPLAIKALAPGLVLVMLSCLASWNAFSHFRRVRQLG